METVKVKDPQVFKRTLDRIGSSLTEFGRIAKKLEDPNDDYLLSQLMEKNSTEIKNESFTVGLLGTSTSVLQNMLDAFFPGTLPLVETADIGLDYLYIIKSNNGSFQIQSKIGSTDFKSLKELVEGMKKHPEKRTARIGIPWNPSLSDFLQFIILPDNKKLIISPALNSFIGNRCNSLIISYSTNDDCKDFISTTEPIMGSFEYIYFFENKEAKSEEKMGDEFIYVKKIFPFIKYTKLPIYSSLYPGLEDPIPPLLVKDDQVLRSALFSKKKSLELVSSLSLAGAELEEHKKEIMEKKISLSKLLTSNTGKDKIDKIREGGQKIKNICQQKFAEMEQGVKDVQTFRIKMTKTDIYDDDKGETPLIDRIVKIGPEDLELEKKDMKTLKVIFNSKFMTDYKQLLLEEVGVWNQNDLDIIRKGLKNLTEEIKNHSTLFFESIDKLEIPNYNFNLSSNLRENEIIIRYQFVIPNYDNFLNLFTEARSAVMSVIMLGGGVIATLGFFLPVFKEFSGATAVVGILLAIGTAVFKIFNRESAKRERLMEERDKIVDYLGNEVMKTFAECNRSIQELIFRENKEWLGKFNRTVDDSIKDVIGNLETESQENRKMLEKRVAVSDQKLKNTENLIREFQRTIQDLNRANDQINQDYQKLITGML